MTSSKATKEEPEELLQEAVPQAASEPVSKQRITIHISSAVIDRVKNLSTGSQVLTLAGFAEKALAQALENLRRSVRNLFLKEKNIAYAVAALLFRFNFIGMNLWHFFAYQNNFALIGFLKL